jgi:signal transduction histidine kinase
MKVMFSGRPNLFFSFRAQTVIFMAALLLLTTTALYRINKHFERQLTQQLDRHIGELTLATDIALRSLDSSQRLDAFVPQESQGQLKVSPENIVRHILVADPEGKIKDSTDPDDIDRQLKATIGDLPRLSPGDITHEADTRSNDQGRTMTISVPTTQGKRDIIIVVSMNELNKVVRDASRDRLIAMAVLGVLLIIVISIFSHRLTRPITELARAARRITSGDLDFQVKATQRNEIGALAVTFNEMLSGLRSKRELEEKLQRAERSAVVGRLASGIAHEIRNPLNFINLSIDHLREKFAPASDAARAEYSHLLGMIKDEIARLNRMVNDFLSYGRPARLKLRDLDTRQLLEEVIGLVKVQAAQQDVKLTIREADGDQGDSLSKHHLRADAEQIKTCFSNLVINAIQAMPSGGALTITLHPRDSEIKIEFADTGPGIAPEAMGQIFEPYFSTKETGIGLGLPLTKKIIEEHGGQITIKSEPGAGAIFTLILPREPVRRQLESSPQIVLSTP